MIPKGTREDQMMKGAFGRFVVCERIESPLYETFSFLERVLHKWAVRPLSTSNDPEEAKANADARLGADRTAVVGVLDAEKNEWIVYPKPRDRLRRWLRR